MTVRILIVEDNRIAVMDLREQLTYLGYEVAAGVASGEEALLKIGELHPDLILMDILLKGGLDGIQTADEVRRRWDLPVVFLTAHSDADTLRRARVAEPYGYILKPVEDRELHTSIEIALYRHEMEHLLRESETRYRTLFTTMAQGVVYQDVTGAITSANPAAERILGLSLDQMMGRTSADPRWRAIHEDGSAFPGAEHPAMVALRTGAPVNGIVMGVYHSQTDETRWILVDAVPEYLTGETVPYRVYTTFTDITERKRAEEQVRKLSRAVEQSPASVVITDPMGNIEYVNPKFTELTGYSFEEAYGQNPRILKSGETSPEEYRRLWSTITSGKVWHGEFHNRRRNGELYWEQASISPIIDPYGTITSYLAVKEDITERKRVEEALQQYAAELEIRNDELDAFAHTVAHDLRAPAARVAGFAELLETEFDAQSLSPTEFRECLKTIARSARKMSSIIVELLLLAEVRKADVKRQPLNMASIVAEAMHHLADAFSASHAEVILTDRWPAALGYAPWIEEVWVNYLSNALKYGGQPPRVELGGAMEADGMARFWVRDNGPGLTPDEQARLFAPFTRLAKAPVHGHGLGLSIVQRIIDKLGGQVSIVSEGVPGQGCVFSFTLPSAAEATEASPGVATQAR